MGIVRYPIASSTALQKAFNLDGEVDDVMFLYPCDVTPTSFGKKMSRGELVSFGIIENGTIQLMDNNDPGTWGASQLVVKDVVVKTCGDLSNDEIQMIENGRPGFEDAFRKMKLKLHDQQIITLVRFSLKNAIHFSNRFLPEHIGKLVH